MVCGVGYLGPRCQARMFPSQEQCWFPHHLFAAWDCAVGSNIFPFWWAFWVLALFLFAAWIGIRAGLGPQGILIDDRGRYSLNHLQITLWSIVVLSCLLGVLFTKGFDFKSIEVPAAILGLIGVSTGS